MRGAPKNYDNIIIYDKIIMTTNLFNQTVNFHKMWEFLPSQEILLNFLVVQLAVLLQKLSQFLVTPLGGHVGYLPRAPQKLWRGGLTERVVKES